jgi:DNA-directed RNA polymerase subunit RPC12/RpoP
MCGKHVFHWGEPLHGAMFTDGGEWTELVVENASPEQAIAATCEPWNMRSDRAVQAANERKVDERDTVPVTKYQMALDDAREASRDAEMWRYVASTYQSKCRSLEETNADLRRIIDERMPRPTNPRNTCVILEGKKPPEEVMFIRDEGGVTHYMPESTCTMDPDGYYGEQYGVYKCSNCGELWQFECDGPREHRGTCCPHCRARIKEDE